VILEPNKLTPKSYLSIYYNDLGARQQRNYTCLWFVGDAAYAYSYAVLNTNKGRGRRRARSYKNQINVSLLVL